VLDLHELRSLVDTSESMRASPLTE
jgi:hypothetical protein